MKERKVQVPETYLKDLEKRVRDMQALFDVSSIISSTLDYRELISLVMEKAKSVMEAEACSILLYNSDTERLEFQVAMGPQEEASETLKQKVSLKMGEGIGGSAAEQRKPLLIKDASKDPRFFKGADSLTGFTTRSMIATPLIGRSGLIGVAEIINPVKKESFGDYDVDIMNTFSRQIAVAIENARFYRASIDRERLRRELEIASVVQKSFLPERPSVSEGMISASAYNVPARHVGGDLYDFVKYKDGRLGVFIGDVSGKGVSAALYMAKIVSEFRFIAGINYNPAGVLNELNNKLLSAPRGMFLTCIYMIIDTGTGHLSYANAGHPPCIYITPSGANAVESDYGPPLGITNTTYPENRLSLGTKEGLLLLTDGAYDAKDIRGQRLGMQNLIGVAGEVGGEDNAVQMIADYVDKFSKGVEMADDITLVSIVRQS